MVKQEGEHTVSGVERERPGRNHPHPPDFRCARWKTNQRARHFASRRARGWGGRGKSRASSSRSRREGARRECLHLLRLRVAAPPLPPRAGKIAARGPLTSARALAPSAISPPPSFPDPPRLAAHCAPAPFPPDSPSPQACSLPEPRAWTARTAPSAPRRRAPGRARPARCVAPARRDERALPRSLARSPAVTRRGYEPATLRAPRGNASTDIFLKKI